MYEAAAAAAGGGRHPGNLLDEKIKGPFFLLLLLLELIFKHRIPTLPRPQHPARLEQQIRDDMWNPTINLEG